MAHLVKPRGPFIAALEKSRVVVEYIYAWLHSHGKDVEILPYRTIPPDEPDENWREYVDGGDLLIRPKGSEAPLRIEVKGRDVDFTGKQDFPYDDVIVDVARNARDDEGDYPLHSYVTVNRALTHCLVIPANSKEHWIDRKRFDKKEGKVTLFSFCPMDYIEEVNIKFRR